MNVVDADAHVLESEKTWSFISDSEHELKSRLARAAEGSSGPREYWVSEGRVFPRTNDPEALTPEGSREMADLNARLKHMDKLRVDVQVLYPTFFLRPQGRQTDVNLALCRSYNRWLADIWERGQNRLRWIAVPPLANMEAALSELRFGKEHGACGVFVRGIEGARRPSDPFFFPLYSEASRLGLPICIHAATGSYEWTDLFLNEAGFSRAKFPVLSAFHDLVISGVPGKFPDLRWAFVEVSSQWLPYVLNDLELQFRAMRRPWPGKDLLRQNRMYVACQTTDDLPYVIQHAGDDNLVIGTDYGHNDVSTNMEALTALGKSGRLDPRAVEKILSQNPTILYGL